MTSICPCYSTATNQDIYNEKVSQKSIIKCACLPVRACVCVRARAVHVCEERETGRDKYEDIRQVETNRYEGQRQRGRHIH